MTGEFRGYRGPEAEEAKKHAEKMARMKAAEKGKEFAFDKVVKTSKKSADGNIYFEPSSMKDIDLDTTEKHTAGVTEFDSKQYGALTEKKRIKTVPEIVGKKTLTEPLPARKPAEATFSADDLGAGETDEPLELDLPSTRAA